jgi:ABC-2 type transport system ATP-binding protein
METDVVVVKEFRKVYGSQVAAAGISFIVQKGEIFGLLGPNGAGKTTTLECLEGLRKPDSGELRVMGIDPIRDPRKLSTVIGVQLQTSGLPANMTVRETLIFFSAYHNVSPNYTILERLGLEEKMQSQFTHLSLGQQRKLALALAIAHNPQVIFLDEPTAGLDVSTRSELHSLMKELKEEGHTIILATHDMAEAEKLTDQIAILLKGKIVANGSAREITSTGSAATKITVRTEQAVLQQNLTNFPAVTQQSMIEEYSIYFTTNPGATVNAILAYINENNDKLFDLRVERPSLEDRFLEITDSGDK